MDKNILYVVIVDAGHFTEASSLIASENKEKCEAWLMINEWNRNPATDIWVKHYKIGEIASVMSASIHTVRLI